MSFTCSGLACSPPSVRQCVTVSQQVALQSAVASMALLSWRGRAWVLLRVGSYDALSSWPSLPAWRLAKRCPEARDRRPRHHVGACGSVMETRALPRRPPNAPAPHRRRPRTRSEEHTSELKSLMRHSYA